MFARGNNRQLIFEDDLDRATYLGLLGTVVVLMRWRCLSYCLMPNHVHLVVETPDPNLAAGMCRLHGQYARWFNRRHRRVGHLFQSRYGSSRVHDDAQFWMTLAYVARNPVAAGLCKSAEGWSWSSHAAILDAPRRPAWLDVPRLFAFVAGISGRPGAEAYRRCVDGS